jgi:hypothetical protein
MNAHLSISTTDLDVEDLQAMARDVCEEINGKTSVNASLSEERDLAGTKGDIGLLGQIALTFLSGGAAVALIDLLKSYFDRNSSLEVAFERPDGKKLKILAENMGEQEIERTREMAREFFHN